MTPDAAPAPRDRSLPLLLLCFFLSGVAALVYQTAWTREFAFVFGTSELAVATVLAAYMGGLAAGAAAAARLAQRVARPVLVYGLLELGIALAALAVPFALDASRALYVAGFGSGDALPDAGGLPTALFYVACSFVILLVPTAMMGATLPLLARHAVRDERQIGARVGLLYAVNTAGAIAGTLVAAFWLLPALGLRATVLAAAGVNALVFAAAAALAQTARVEPVAAVPVPPMPAAAHAGRARWILPLALGSGFASFTYEVLWVRLVSHLVGAGVTAFATMLASFLAGIALGSAAASRWAASGPRAARGFALAQLGVAALSLAAFAALDRIPGLVDALARRGDGSIAGVLACIATLFPAALCIGATFPFAVRVLARDADDAGPAAARVYAWNTVGAIAGSLAAGFVLIPALGFAHTLGLAAALNLVLGGAAALLFEPRMPLRAGLALASAACVAVAALAPKTPWRVLRSAPSEGGGAEAWGEVAFFAVGRSATVLATDQHYSFALRSNGLPEAGIQRAGPWRHRNPLTRWLSALPVLARPELRSLLLVGLGGGTAIEVVPRSVARIDVIELEPEVLAANQRVAAERWRDPLADPRVRVHLNDARNALLLASGARFDAIVSQPSHPWAGGAAHLYTGEFFALAHDRLAPGGVFVQWIGLPFVDELLFRSLLATLAATFAHVHVFAPPPGGSVLFIASDAPLDWRASSERALASAPDDFAQVGIHAAEDLLASWVLDDAGVRALAAGAPENRDAHNRLQTHSDRLDARTALFGRLDALCERFDPLARALPPGIDPLALVRRLDPVRAQRVATALPDPLDRETGLAIAELAARAPRSAGDRAQRVLAADPQHREARAVRLRAAQREIERGGALASLVAAPIRDPERAVAAGWAARGSDADLAAVARLDPLHAEATRLRIAARLRAGGRDRALEAAELSEAGLGDRPTSLDLVIRAEAYAAAGESAVALETIALLQGQLAREPGSHAGITRRAAELVLAIPERGELARAREDALRRLGL